MLPGGAGTASTQGSLNPLPPGSLNPLPPGSPLQCAALEAIPSPEPCSCPGRMFPAHHSREDRGEHCISGRIGPQWDHSKAHPPQRTVLSSQLGDINTRLFPGWERGHSSQTPRVPAPVPTLTNLRLQDLPLQASSPHL